MSISNRGYYDDPEPEAQYEFETSAQWAEYVGEKFFKDLVPGAPFLLIMRRLEYDSRRHTSQTWMETMYFVGILAESGPLFGLNDTVNGNAGNSGMFISAREFVYNPETYHEEKLVDRVQGPIQIATRVGFNYTPVTKTFKPPYSTDHSHDVFDQGVEMFSVACGVPAMEELVANQAQWDSCAFPAWYACAIARLRIPAIAESVVKQLEAEKVTLIKLLRRHHMKNSVGDITRILLLAKEFGMHEEFDYLMVDGFRCQPAIVIEDFAALYAT